LSLYDKVDLEILERSDEIYKDYYEQLTTRSGECENLLLQVNNYCIINKVHMLNKYENYVILDKCHNKFIKKFNT